MSMLTLPPPILNREAITEALRLRTSIRLIPTNSPWLPYANPGTLLTYQRFLLTLCSWQCLLLGEALSAVFLLALASLTDLLDGKIARSLACESRFGGKLDPWGDKFMLLLVWNFSEIAAVVIILSEITGIFSSHRVRKNAGKHVIAKGSKHITAGQMFFLCFLILLRFFESQGIVIFPAEQICLLCLMCLSFLRAVLYIRLLRKNPSL